MLSNACVNKCGLSFGNEMVFAEPPLNGGESGSVWPEMFWKNAKKFKKLPDICKKICRISLNHSSTWQKSIVTNTHVIMIFSQMVKFRPFWSHWSGCKRRVSPFRCRKKLADRGILKKLHNRCLLCGEQVWNSWSAVRMSLWWSTTEIY
jgi:hypothetical protein